MFAANFNASIAGLEKSQGTNIFFTTFFDQMYWEGVWGKVNRVS